MPFRLLCLPLIFLITGAYAAAETEPKPEPASPAWPHEVSDIPPDPRLHFGTLENGFRYVTMKHAEPPGRVSIRLYVHAGSLMESDAQRGLAHFLEHMAFNGTRHYAGTEIVEFLQRLGMAFGPDINAHTSFDETVYKLDLPDTAEETLDRGLTIMRDWADGMLLDPEEIDRERGVILKEKLGRDSIAFRLMEAELEFLFPDSLIAKRMPIGVEEVIQNAPRERFQEFYQTYYRPDRMILVVVGDIDPGALEPKIKSAFEAMARPEGKVPDLALGPLTQEGVRSRVEAEPEAVRTTVSITTLQPYEAEPDTAGNRAEDLPLRLANAMVNRRLSILAKKAEAPFAAGSVYGGDFFQYAEMANVELTCQPEQWMAALGTAEKEIRKAAQHGFNASELKEAKAELLNAYQRAVETAPTEKAPEIANEIVSSLGDREVYSSPQEDLRIVSQAFASITPDECRQAFSDRWSSEHVNLMISGNLQDVPGPDQVTQAFLASREETVEAPTEEELAAFAYREFGPPSQVTSREVVEDLEITQLVFSNGVRVNLKPTPFEKDTVRITAAFGGGKLSQPADKEGIDLFAGAVFEAAGLEKHSADDLQRLFAGKNVGISFSIDDGHFVMSGRTTPGDLQEQLQLMGAYLVAPGYREEAAARLRKMIPIMINQIETTPEGVMQAKVDRFIHGGDPRWGIPGREALEALTMGDVKAWIDQPLKKAPLEVSVVGEFKVSEIIPMIQSTFGALPDRRTEREDFEEGRQVSFPKGENEKRFSYDSKLGKSLTLVYWPTTDRLSDVQTARRLTVMSNVLADRLRSEIREELGEAYSPMAHHVGSDVFPGYGILFAMSPGATDKAELVGKRIVELGAALAREGADEDEFDRALKPILTSLKEQTRDNSYWLTSVLRNAQENPERLDWARTLTSDFEAVQLEEINALAAKYLQPEQALQVLVLSAKTEGEAAPETDPSIDNENDSKPDSETP